MKLWARLLIGAAVITSIASTAPSPSPKIPKKLEGLVKQTVSYNPPKKTIVHLKQRHVSLTYSRGSSVRKVVKSQNKIYDYIINNGIKELYVEGMTPEILKIYKIRKLDGFEYKFSADKLEADKPYTPKDLAKLGYRPAWSRLAAEGSIEVLPLERMDRYMRAQEALETHIGKDATQKKVDAVYNDREDGMLEDLAGDPKEKVYVLLGGAHDFRDNIGIWNRDHPDNSYRLIEVETSE
jgi:hypothetical protein